MFSLAEVVIIVLVCSFEMGGGICRLLFDVLQIKLRVLLIKQVVVMKTFVL
jgi:hypothetical protein